MPNGLAKPLLLDLANIAGSAYPGYKIDAHGFVGMALVNGSTSQIRITNEPGTKRQVDIRYKKRYTKAQTDTALSCDAVLTPSWQEGTVSVNNIRQIAIHLDDETVAQYMADASARVNIPGATPGASVIQELVTDINHAANAIFDGVNDDLLGLLSWGVNRTTGVATSTTLNISKDVNVQELNDGINRLLADYRKNNLTGRPQVVGSGLFANWAIGQAMKSGADAFGFDTRLALSAMDFYHDQDFDQIVGSNQIGVFEPGAVHMVEYNRYTGFKAGEMGTSTFFQVPVPFIDPVNNIVRPIMLDAQLKYADCPATYTDAYTGGSVSLDKGWNLILSKTFGLYQIPSDSYRMEDSQFGVNGALRYTVTNACETCA